MHIPKRYGESRIDSCPFCGRQSLIKNSQGIPVCSDHKNMDLPEMKCACGEYLLMQQGKFGAFFNCLRCGNVNMKKALEINSDRINKVTESGNTPVKKPSGKVEYVKKNVVARDQVVRSDDPRYF